MNDTFNNMVRRKTTDILNLIPLVPSFQRLTDRQRVNDIFSSLKQELSEGKEIILPGCVVFAKTKKTYWIIDGLHRLEVYKRVLKELNVDFNIYC